MSDQPPENPGFFDPHRPAFPIPPQPQMDPQQAFSLQQQLNQFAMCFPFKDMQQRQLYAQQFLQFRYPQFYGYQSQFQQFQPPMFQQPVPAAPEPASDEQKADTLPIPIFRREDQRETPERPKRQRRAVLHTEDGAAKKRVQPVKREPKRPKQDAMMLQCRMGTFDTDDGSEDTDWAEEIYY